MIVGVLGGGQLGRMLALAGYPLGFRFRFLETQGSAVASLADVVKGPFEDRATLERFVGGLDVVTYEFENVPVDSARFIASRVPHFAPTPDALEVSQDRLREKRFFQELGIPTAPFAPVDSRADLDRGLAEIGVPAVLKTRRLGYDGKGQLVLRDPDDAARAFDTLGGVPLILEGFIPFERELSVIAVRSRAGATAFYPLTENHHADAILRLSIAPAPAVSAELRARAEEAATRVLDALGYVGVLTIELFEHGGRLLANEMATRVHNSGHWTIEGAETSQFENHLRAVAGLPLGSVALRGHSAMVNLIGTLPDRAAILEVPGAHLHLYDKSPAPGRKLGHVTIRAETPATLAELVARTQRAVGG